MRLPNFNPHILIACLILLLISSAARGEIYKWVDEKGRTHYSESKADAGKAKAEELKVKSSPVSGQSNSSEPYWQEQERQFKQRQAQKANERTNGPSGAATIPKSLSGGRSDNTAESKCNLARDVLSGAVRHSNGAKTDKNDREIAENDVRMFCGKNN